MPKDEPNEPISGRVPKPVRESLERAAKRAGRSLSWLVGRVLEDYAAWLDEQK